MKTFIRLLVLSLFVLQVARAADDAAQFWPQWRGPLFTGVGPNADPPTQWSETKNVKWKTKLPGEGNSTPIIWADRIFILSAIPTGKQTKINEASGAQPDSTAPPPGPGQRRRGPPGGFRPGGPGGPPGGFGRGRGEAPSQPYQFVVACYNRQTGKLLWQKAAREEVPHEGRQQNNTFASGSPVTDGSLVMAFFGSRGLYCYDMDGNLKWKKDFGKMVTRNGFGEGASPALSGNTLVVPWDHEGDDFIVALDKTTGKELWRKARNEPTGWSTPLPIVFNGKTQVVVNATHKVRSYDLANGAVLWECGGQTDNAIPSPVAADGMVYVTSGFRGSALDAIRLGRSGDLTGTDAIAWHHERDTPYVPSPLLVDGLLYVIANNNAVISCFDAKSGKANFQHERLEGIFGIYASPVAAKDRVYVLGREGTCIVLKKGPKPEVLAKNKLDDHTDASIALVGKELFIRGGQSLYCISQ